jgi:hypothetical protein
MGNPIDYKDQLKFFFSKRGSDIDNATLNQLNLMSDDEVRTLYDIVFAQNEKDRLTNIDLFYQKLEAKKILAEKEMSEMKNKMSMVFEELQELSDKSLNEEDFSKNITTF